MIATKESIKSLHDFATAIVKDRGWENIIENNKLF